MTKPGLSWRNAQLPPKTAVFAIGDVHAQDQLLAPLLASIEAKIAALPPDVTAHVIFIGDYIDRGHSAPDTIDKLLDFEKRMKEKPNVKTAFLCGNHEDCIKRLLDAETIIDGQAADPQNRNDLSYCVADQPHTINFKWFEAALFSSGIADTIKNYCPDIDDALLHECVNRDHPGFLERSNAVIKQFQAAVNEKYKRHAEFYNRAYDNHHIIVGDYLFTHAGIDPNKTLEEQGIDRHHTLAAQPLMNSPSELERLQSVMIRDPFLWRDDLLDCPYIVVHGHTPSAIKAATMEGGAVTHSNTIADSQKNDRLCIDTDVYNPGGALTCFIRSSNDVAIPIGDSTHENYAGFMAVNNSHPCPIVEYSIPKSGQLVAQLQQVKYWENTGKFPVQYHRNEALAL